MIHSIWSGKNKLYWLLLPFSFLYGWIVKCRQLAYKLGLSKSYSVPVPVIIIGNLSVGGNGKTPLVIFLAEQLTKKDFKVGIISRGYGGKSKYYPFMVDETTKTDQAGDEPVLIFNRTHCPIALSPNRYEAAMYLLKKYPEINVILSDDGLQHYRLQREIEIAVVDTHKGFGNGHYLPAGPLREKPNRLKQVQFTILNGDKKLPNLPKTAFEMKLLPKQAINLKTKQSVPLDQFHQVVACAGIGNPERFFKTLKKLGITLISEHTFSDHHQFQLQELQVLAKPTQALMMTEKDAVKCFDFAQENWWYLPIEASLPTAFLDELLHQLRQLTQLSNKQ